MLYQVLISGLVKEPMTPPIAISATIQMIKEKRVLFCIMFYPMIIVISTSDIVATTELSATTFLTNSSSVENCLEIR